jgi:TRAP-type C4-dicarboxylate transport system substrate-binding protein
MSSRHASRPIGTLIAAAAGLAVLMGAPAAFAQDKTFELKLSHWVPPAHPLHKMLEEWGASVEKASGGTIKYKVYPSEQLGKAMDHYDMAKDGIADVTYVSPGYQPGRFPIIDASNLPFMANNAKEGTAAVDEWYRKYAGAEMKDVKFCFAFLHDPGSFHSRNKKVMTPADIKGMKIRPAHATIATLVTQLGGTNIPGAAPQVRDFLEKGVADAATFPWGSVVLFGVDKVTKYHMNAPLYVTTFVWIMNQAKYNQMSAAQKKVIDDHCNSEWAVRLASPWADFEHGGIAKIAAEPGHEVYTITPAQLNEWRQASEPVVKAWTDQVRKAGGNPDAALSELKQSLDKHKSITN